MTKPTDLPAGWRVRAAELEPYSAPGAFAWRAAAAELEEAMHAAADEALTLGEAAEQSGYSRRRLRELIADGTVPNAGRKGAPRIRRGDLPMRPRAATASNSGYRVDDDAAELARRLG